LYELLENQDEFCDMILVMAFEITAHLDKFDEIKDHTIYY